MSLSGKIAIVTGGARGIGAGIVRALAKQGASVSPALIARNILPGRSIRASLLDIPITASS